MQPRIFIRIFVPLLVMMAFWVPLKARAACTTPAATMGAIENFAGVHKLCDGTNWNTIDLDSTVLSSCQVNNSRKYDSSSGTYQVCNSGSSKKINCVTATGTDDQTCSAVSEVKLIASDGISTDTFGIAVAIYGDVAVIGSPGVDVGPITSRGSAYVYQRTTNSWAYKTTLIPDTNDSGMNFGTSVAIYEDTILVGVPGDISSRGSVFVFTYNQATKVWSQQGSKLTDTSGASNDKFGDSVAIYKDTAIIGATNYTGAGAAYVYTRSGSTWTQETIIQAADRSASDSFGRSVAINGNTILVAAFQDSDGGMTNYGSVYVYTGSGATWTEQTKLYAPIKVANSYFGYSVALENDIAVVGTPFPTSIVGSAYVFTRTGTSWNSGTSLVPSGPVAASKFGASVAIWNGRIAVGATDQGSGFVYLFSQASGSWSQDSSVNASDGVTGDAFGKSVSLSNNTLLVGAYFDAISGNTLQGSAYMKPLTPFIGKVDSQLSESSQFGYSTAVFGDTAVVGSPSADGTSADQGLAFVYIRNGNSWVLQTTLVAGDPAAGDAFGSSVAIHGDTIVVGARSADPSGNANQGAAYVFVRSGSIWSQQAKLVQGAAGDNFGVSVDIYENTIIVGADFNDTGIVDRGAAHIFTRSSTTWTLQQTIQASHSFGTDQFGYSVAIHKDTVIVGAPDHDHNGQADGGVAYIFTRSGVNWTEQAELLSPVTTFNGYLGTTVDIEGDVAIVGAPGEQVSASLGQGVVYVFMRSGATWLQHQKLTASDGTSNYNFGYFVSLSGDTALIGSVGDDLDGVDGGSAYIFTKTDGSWFVQQKKLAPSDKLAGDKFGFSGAIHNNFSLVGAPLGDVGANTNRGTAYFYDVNQTKDCSRGAVTLKGTAISKTATTSLALSNVTVPSGETLLICVSAASDTIASASWNSNTLGHNISYEPSGLPRVSIFSFYNSGATASADVIASFSGPSSTGKAVSVVSVRGQLVFDKFANNSSNAGNPSAGPTAMTTEANELLYACVGAAGPIANSPATWNSPYLEGRRAGTTGGPSGSNIIINDAFYNAREKNTYSAGQILGTASIWSMSLATYKIIPSAVTALICESYGPCTTAGAINYISGSGLRWCDGTRWQQIKTTFP